jgi:hypothetical protein
MIGKMYSRTRSALSRWVLLSIGIFVLDAQPIKAAESDTYRQQPGVRLEVYSRSGKAIFCFGAEENVRLASEYGIEFKVAHDQEKLWDERFPKLVAGSEPYFKLPVRIELRTRGFAKKREVSINLGACVASEFCTPVEFSVSVSERDDEPGRRDACLR